MRRRSAIAATCAALSLVLLAACVGCRGEGASASTWPESDEFEHLLTGQDRFSEHETNLSQCRVVVDHRTGVQYLLYCQPHGTGATVWSYTGLCPLLDVDGSPLRVLEATDDGE